MALKNLTMRQRMKAFVILTAGLVLFNAPVLTVILIAAYPAARPAVQIPQANRNNFVNVVVLIDPTRSIRDNDLALAKTIVKDIIASIGYGDLLTICRLGPVFRPENCFRSMKASENDSIRAADEILAILEEHRVKNGVGRQRFYELLRQFKDVDLKVQESQRQWVALVDSVQRPKLPGSDFCGALNVLEQVFAARLGNRTNSAKVLFVVGDLIQDQPRRCTDGASQQMSWFSGVKVNLIYPLNSEFDWNNIFAFWSTYFGNVKFTRIPFLAAVSGNGRVLAPNPLQGIRKDIPTYVESFWAMAPVLWWTVAISAILGVLVALLLFIPTTFRQTRLDERSAGANVTKS